MEIKITIYINELEPGNHFFRKTINRKRFSTVYLTEEECKEVRPDFGVYHPIITWSKIERSLKQKNLLPLLEENETWGLSLE